MSSTSHLCRKTTERSERRKERRKSKDEPPPADERCAFASLWKLGGASPGEWDEKVASLWYRNNVFRKTYQERRTWFAFYRANFRVIAFHILLYHIMLVVAILSENSAWEHASTALTSIIITHTFLEMLDAYGGA